MGRTNIHFALALFNRSGSSFEETAYIPYADKLVYINTKALTQADLDRFADLLRSNISGSWVRKGSTAAFSYSEPDLALTVPKVTVSFGMQVPGRERRLYSGFRQDEEESLEEVGPEEKEKELVYILITQGSSGDVLSKVVIEPTLERAAAHAMHEALNGYSTVFTAAMLKANVGKLKDASYSFKAVQGSRALKTVDKDYVGFWC